MYQQTEKKQGAVLALILILIVQAVVIIWFGVQKQGYFIDEIYSYGLSNGYYKPFITSYGEEIFDQWADKGVIEDYMTVQEGQRFAYGSVIHNQSQDVHPPLYYLLLHTVSSFFPGEYSKWFGIGINLVCFGISGIFLWLTGRRMMNSKWLGLVPVIVWGFSAGAVSYTIYIRMYMVMTMFTILSAYLHGKMARTWQRPKELIMLFCVTVCGILTQYYFIIFAFYLSAAYCLLKLFHRAVKQAAVYALVMFGAVGTSVFIFPACIMQLTRTGEVVAEETRKNIGNLDTFVTNMEAYGYGVGSDFLSGLYQSVLILLALFVAAFLLVLLSRRFGWGKQGNTQRRKDLDSSGFLISAGWLGAVFTIAGVAVVPSPRYISNLYPLMVLSGIWVLWKLLIYYRPALLLGMWGTAALFLCLSLTSYTNGFVQYLYEDEPARLAVADQYKDLPCLYVTNYRVAALTQDLRTLSRYREFYVTRKEKLQDMDSILKGRDTEAGLIVTVDNNAFWGSGYDAEAVVRDICGQTGMTVTKCLFAEELSVTYLLEKE